MNHYELLGVPPDSDAKAIQRAFRRHARQLHPDTNPDPAAQETLAHISAAYAVLSDAGRRAGYDRSIGIVAAPVPRAPSVAADVADIRQDGLDLHLDLQVPHADLAAGFTRTVTLRYTSDCDTCSGTGFAGTGPTRPCPTCSGLGMHAVTGQRCETCTGIGRVYDTPCVACGGARRTRVEVDTPLTFAAGANGTVRFPRHGVPGTGRGSSRGHLYVTLHPEGPAPTAARVDDGRPDAEPAAVDVDAPGPVFLTAGNGVDLGLVQPVHYGLLRAGGTVRFPRPDGGRGTLAVPAGTAPGTILVVVGAGGRHPDGRLGDLHVRLDLHWPADRPDEHTRGLLAALATAETPPAPTW